MRMDRNKIYVQFSGKFLKQKPGPIWNTLSWRKDNIKMDAKEVWCDDMDWIDLIETFLSNKLIWGLIRETKF
jgi:hypothetical protein